MNISYISDYMKANNHIGAEKGITAKVLLPAAIGLEPSKSNIRAFQRDLYFYRCNWTKKDGIERYICSDRSNGYYLPENIKDVERFIATQKSQADKMSETTKHIEKYINENETGYKQFHLFDTE
ncbi:MAG: hypothetical protein LIO62_04845 [Clostridiales bacterium]|nr:hypothetical protein [Clostridiales bacterium]